VNEKQMTYYTGIGASVSDVFSGAQVALRVADDPALSTVVSLIQEIKGLPSKGPAGPPTRGVGLSKIVTPLRGFVAYKKHPWIVPAFVGGAVLVIFSLGVMTGRRRPRKTP
jgi:hypothetical protein